MRLIALDVDGTLLNSAHELAPATSKAIARAMQRNIRIVLASGKQYRQLTPLVQRLKLHAPQIACDGAQIVDPGTDESVFEGRIGRETARRVLRLGWQHGVTMGVPQDGVVYVVQENEDAEYMRSFGEEVCVMAPLSTALWTRPTHLLAVTWKRISAQRQWASALHRLYWTQVSCVRSARYYAEVLLRGVSKGAALKWLATRLSIDREEILAIGDGENDVSMFRGAGYSVAMGNATGKVKAEAHFLAPSCDEDGVAIAIEECVRAVTSPLKGHQPRAAVGAARRMRQ